jgi:pimeloyl-ACP methyl ester carboxylesterase
VSTAAGAAFARLGELELYNETQGTGPPLVLIHGSLMTASLMNDYPALLAAGRRVITVELQGHGHTRDISRPLRYELLADDIAALLGHLGLARADLFGYTGLCDRAEWVVPMIAEFLGDAGG